MGALTTVTSVLVLRDIVIPRTDKGKRDLNNIKVRRAEPDQLFAMVPQDIEEINITVREVDYTYLKEAEKRQKYDEITGEPIKDAGTESTTATAPARPQDVKERKLGLARVNNKWMLTAPIHAQADPGAADGLASAIADLRWRARYTDVDPLDPKYGLDNPSLRATIKRKRGPDIELLIGRDTPIGSEIYMTVMGSKTLYCASSSVKTSLIKEAKDLRNKKVADFDKDDVKRLILNAAGAQIVCEQVGKKDAKEWWLSKPVDARADDFAVGDAIDAIQGLEAKDFVDNVQSLSAYGLDKPTVVARLDFGKGKDDVVIKLGKHVQKAVEDTTSSTYSPSTSTPQDLVYCVAEGRDEVFLVAADVENKLDKKAIDFRDTDIVDFENSKVKRIVVTRQEGTSLELVNADGKWSLKKPEFADVDTMKVDDMLFDLKGLKAADFLEGQEVSPTVSGLSNPAIDVKLYLEGKEEPIEMKFGYKEEKGLRYYCQTSTLSSPVLVESTFKDAIPESVEELKKGGTSGMSFPSGPPGDMPGGPPPIEIK